MSELLENGVSEGIDRRSVLKKAAIAGTVAWAAPLVISSPALASACTPSCAAAPITSAQLTGQVADLCANQIALLAPFTGNANKIAVFRVISGTASCPCGNANPVIGLDLPPGTSFSKGNNPRTGPCDPFVNSPSNPLVKESPGFPPYPLAANEIMIYKTGALPNGWYTASHPVCITIKCEDDLGGDPVYRTCKFTMCFEYSPEGACGAFNTYGSKFTLVPNSCTVSCSPISCA